MAQDNSHQQVADAIRAAIADTPRKSKQVLLKTLLKQFGHKTRQKHYVEAIDHALSAAGVLVSPALENVQRDEWVRLSVTDPALPIADFAAGGNGQAEPIIDPWLTSIASKEFASEKEVEIRFVIPLLERLGYDEDDRADGYPVEQVVGVRKTRTEADFVLFDGRNRSRNSALMVVEAKAVGKNLTDHIHQARSYAMFLGTPYFMVTNANEIRVFLYRSPIESDVEVFRSSCSELPKTFNDLYNLISKKAVIGYKIRLLSK
jgi:hypothetical protein